MCHFTKSFWLGPKKKNKVWKVFPSHLPIKRPTENCLIFFLDTFNPSAFKHTSPWLSSNCLGAGCGKWWIKPFHFGQVQGFKIHFLYHEKIKKKLGTEKRIGFGEGNCWKSWLVIRVIKPLKLISHNVVQAETVQDCYLSDRTNYTQCRWQIASNYSLIAAFWIVTCIHLHLHRCYICQNVFTDTLYEYNGIHVNILYECIVLWVDVLYQYS